MNILLLGNSYLALKAVNKESQIKLSILLSLFSTFHRCQKSSVIVNIKDLKEFELP
jgi:hypothetical protein